LALVRCLGNGTTREVLKAAGPDVGASRDSVGGIAIAYGGRYAIAVLNNGLRPFLAKWHPLLQAWEARRPLGVSPKEQRKSIIINTSDKIRQQ